MQCATETIRSLRPNVSREQAMRQFTGGVRGLLASLLKGPARSSAEFHIPYRLFQVTVTNNGGDENRIYALDSVAGALDLFEFREIPKEPDVLAVTTRNAVPSLLAEERARELIVDKVRHVIFSRGFARLRNFRLEAEAVPGEIHVPYWICLRGNDKALRIEVLDAVRGRTEGAKVCQLVEDWLRSTAEIGNR
jgi:hypothetical protein